VHSGIGIQAYCIDIAVILARFAQIPREVAELARPSKHWPYNSVINICTVTVKAGNALAATATVLTWVRRAFVDVHVAGTARRHIALCFVLGNIVIFTDPVGEPVNTGTAKGI